MAEKKFVLEQVLNYRREIEKLKTQEFVAAKRDLEVAEDHLKNEEEKASCLAREFNSRQQEIECIVEMQMYSDFFAKKREDIKLQKERVVHLDKVMSVRREYLVDATRDKKVLESLKEKKKLEFKQEMAQKERAFLDEISIQKKDKTR